MKYRRIAVVTTGSILGIVFILIGFFLRLKGPERVVLGVSPTEEQISLAIAQRENRQIIQLIKDGKISANFRLAHFPGQPTLLHIAATVDNGELVTHLLTYAEVDPNFSCADQCAGTPLSAAILSKNLLAIRALLNDPRVYLDEKDPNISRGIRDAINQLPADLNSFVMSRLRKN